jgi:hypothetical protein
VVDAFGNDHRSMFVDERHIVMLVCQSIPQLTAGTQVSFYLSVRLRGVRALMDGCSRHDNSPAILPGDRQRPSSGETQTVS